MIDAELVTRKCVLIMRDLEALRAVAAHTRAEYLANARDQAAVERYVERMIGRMIDINYHLLVESGQAPPSDYHASFLRLVELGVFDREFAARIARSAGLRNRIVHEYDEVDPAKVFDALQSALTDVPNYVSGVNDFLARQSR